MGAFLLLLVHGVGMGASPAPEPPVQVTITGDERDYRDEYRRRSARLADEDEELLLWM